MKNMLKIISLQVIIVLALSVSAYAAGASGTKVKIGDKAPEFTLKDFLTGEKHSLKQYRGKIVLIQFWATWCSNCKREIPMLVNLYNTNKSKGDFVVLSILLPSGRSDEKNVKELKKKYKISYPILLDVDNKVATGKYELSGLIPVIGILDKEGVLQFEHVGVIEPDILEMVLDDIRSLDEEE